MTAPAMAAVHGVSVIFINTYQVRQQVPDRDAIVGWLMHISARMGIQSLTWPKQFMMRRTPPCNDRGVLLQPTLAVL